MLFVLSVAQKSATAAKNQAAGAVTCSPIMTVQEVFASLFRRRSLGQLPAHPAEKKMLRQFETKGSEAERCSLLIGVSQGRSQKCNDTSSPSYHLLQLISYCIKASR
jgi:hypothetical protein